VHFARKTLGETQLGATGTGAVLSIWLPPGISPERELPGLVDDAIALRGQLGAPSWLSFEGRPPDVDWLAARGVVLFGLAHMRDTDLADASVDPRPGHGGLTPLGVETATHVYAMGALVDVSHLSDDAFDRVAALARAAGKPIVASHSGARALGGSLRDLTDEQIREIGRSGGVVGLPLHAPMLDPSGHATAVDWARHVEHVIELAGVDAAALGSDMDGEITPISDVPGAAAYGVLVATLAARGWSDATIAAVLGGNARRVLARAMLSSNP
jgi:membrane dipeptidase